MIVDRVFIGPGAVIRGRIAIEDEACVGAGAVVTKDVPARAVVVGNPAQIVSYEGPDGYVNRAFEVPSASARIPDRNAGG